MRKLLAGLLSALVVIAAPASAQTYPSRPVTIVVPFAAGGNGDITARMIADLAKETWNQSVVVENRPGGGGAVGIGQVARAAADGYTIAFVSTSPIVVAPHLGRPPFDPLKDLAYLGQVAINHQPVVVRANSPFRSLADMLAFARANPGRLRWSAAAIRGGPHIATEAMFRAEGVQTTYVPFGGGAEAMTALLAGDIEAAVIADYTQALAAGQVRLIAESGPVRIASQPDVPTYRDLGYSLAPAVFIGFAAPAGTPAAIVARWDAMLAAAVRSPRYTELMQRLGSVVVYRDSATFTREVHENHARLGEAIRALGMAR